MREIKFRVWDNVDEKYLWFFSSETLDTIFGQSHSDKPINERQGRIFLRTQSEYVLQQFTGIHDKNGKEIYDGDIISSDNFSSNLVIGYSNEKAAFVGSRTNSFKISEIYNFLDDIVIDDNWEVIGNIYENPDLL